MKRFDYVKPAHQAGLLLLLIVSLTACAPASECELGENADGTCALFEYTLVMPRSPNPKPEHPWSGRKCGALL